MNFNINMRIFHINTPKPPTKLIFFRLTNFKRKKM